MNKTVKYLYVFGLSLRCLSLFSEEHIQSEISYSQEKIVPEASINKLTHPINPQFGTYEKELDRLGPGVISDETLKSQAPIVYNLLHSILTQLTQKAGITMPSIAISTNNDEKFYNAEAQTQKAHLERTITKTVNGVVEGVEKEQKFLTHHTLIVGSGTLRLFLLHPQGINLLRAVIAHEVGHMFHNHDFQTIQAEKEADQKAVALIGPDHADDLVTAINMITLAGHLSGNLRVNAAVFNLPTNKTEDLVIPLVNSVIQEHPKLGELGQSSSHSKFGCVVLKVLEDSLKTLAVLKQLTPAKDYIIHLINTVYDKLLDSCINQARLFGDTCDLIDEKMARVEQYTNKIYSHITHPNPLDRMTFIESCNAPGSSKF